MRSGPFEILVDRESANQQESTVSDVIPINHNHSNLVKFAEDSVDYAVIARKLREVAGDRTLDSPQDAPTTATVSGERPGFDPWKLYASFSQVIPLEAEAEGCHNTLPWYAAVAMIRNPQSNRL